MEKKNLSWIYLILTILLFASTPVVSKLLLKEMSSFQLLFWVIPVAILSLFAISLIQGKWKIIKTYKTKDYFNFLYFGFIGIFLYYILFFSALVFTSTQEAFIINYFWPIAIILFAVPILKEKLTSKKILGIAFAFIGIIVIGARGLTALNIGLGWIFAFLAALSWGLFSVLGKKKNYETFTSMAFFHVAGFIFILPFIFFMQMPIPSLIEWLGIIWLGAISGSLAYVFWFCALKYGETSKISTAIFLTPFVSLVYIALILKEPIMLSSVIGLLLIMGGVIVQNTSKGLFKK